MGILEHRGRGGISRTPFRNLEGQMYPWRTGQDQPTRNDVTQLAIHGKQTSLRTQSPNPSLAICIMGTIGRTATMASDLPAHCGGDERLEECRRKAITPHECSCVACQNGGQSHAATVPPSSGSKRHASRSHKAQ